MFDIRENMTSAEMVANLTEDEKAVLRQMHDDPRLYQNMTKSICPQVYGHDDIKRGVLLMLYVLWVFVFVCACVFAWVWVCVCGCVCAWACGCGWGWVGGCARVAFVRSSLSSWLSFTRGALTPVHEYTRSACLPSHKMPP